MLWCMKTLLVMLILAAPGFAVSANAQSQRAVEPLGDGAYLFRHGPHRSLFVVGENGVIVTDPINAEVATAYLAAIRGLTDQPVRYVVYSHYHWDRIAGAEVFTSEGASVVAAKPCVQRLRENPNPAVRTPDRWFSDESRLDVGGRTLELYDFGPAHSDCLTVFVARPANILQLVDLVNPPAAAFPDNPLASYIRPHNLERFFASVAALIERQDIERVAAYRAAPDSAADSGWSPATAPAGIVAEQAEFWALIDATTARAAAEGRVGIDSFVKLRKEELAAFEAYRGFDSQRLPLILRRFTGYHDMGR